MRLHRHKYKNLAFFLLGMLAAFLFAKIPMVSNLLQHLGNYKYLSAFLGGLMFTSTFTLPVGAIILVSLARTLPIPILIPIAVTGAILGDCFAFKFIRKNIANEMSLIYEDLEKIVGKNHFKKIVHTKYFAWTLPVIGTLIMASPLPDELGVSLMGLSNMPFKKFLVISCLSHTLGISIILGIFR